MLTLEQVNQTIITPALQLLPPEMDRPRARIQLLAIGLQESEFKHRVQMGGGPARGFWQFERGGGVRGTLAHEDSAEYASMICTARGVKPEEFAVWNALATDDILAACFARLLLWTDPKPMAQNAGQGWGLYARVWRPGKPHPEKWDDNYARAEHTIMG